MQPPTREEFAPFYDRYVNLAAATGGSDVLRCDMPGIGRLFENLPEEDGNGAYAPGKWTVKEVMLHCIDSERIFAYRALRLLRGDDTPLPGYAQDPYVPASGALHRSIESLHEEWLTVRHATLTLYENAPSSHLTLLGEASGCPISARALAYIIPGHYLHHLGVLRKRYGIDC